MRAMSIGPLKVEVLEVRPDGSARFRLWHEDWQGRYVDVDVVKQKFGGVDVYLGELRADGFITPDDLKDIFMLLKLKRIRTIYLGDVLYLTTEFRDVVLASIGHERKKGVEPPHVEYLGGYKFAVGDYTIEFVETKRHNFYASVRLPTRKDAESLVLGLASLGIAATYVGRVAEFNRDSLFGLMTYTGAVPPGLVQLYNSHRLTIYARKGSLNLYFVARVWGLWKSVMGIINRGSKMVIAYNADHDVVKEIANAIKVELLGNTGGIRVYRGLNMYVMALYKRAIVHILKQLADRLQARPVVIEDGRIEVDGIGVFNIGDRYIKASDLETLLTLYKSLRTAKIRAKLYPDGIKIAKKSRGKLVRQIQRIS